MLRVASRTCAGTGCPRCGLKRRARTQSLVEPARSLAFRYPDIAAELHPSRNSGIDPMQLAARSSLRLWWRCRTCGHEWKTVVSTRTDGCGCPACYDASRRPSSRTSLTDAKDNATVRRNPTLGRTSNDAQPVAPTSLPNSLG